MDYDCFLSHNGRDKPAVRALCERLQAAGLAVWLDENDLPFGKDWQPAIEQAIRDSAAGLVAIGPNGMGEWHQEELEFLVREARRSGRPVIPVLLAGAPDPRDISGFVMNRSACDLRDDGDGHTFDKLVRDLRAYRRAAGPDAPAPHDDAGPPAGTALPSVPIRLLATEDAADESPAARPFKGRRLTHPRLRSYVPADGRDHLRHAQIDPEAGGGRFRSEAGRGGC
jgi:hypothetical protein